MEKLQVAVLLFDDVEVLDFAGPYEVFSRTRLVAGADSRRTDESAPFEVFTLAPDSGVIQATGGLRVAPDYRFADAPDAEILVIPGGFGTRRLLQDETVVDWIRNQASIAAHVTSVCTGALLLAAAGLLRDRRATTHHSALAVLGEIDPSITVVPDARVVSDGVITSGGVAAGIDMAFSVVEMLCGRDVADETAAYIEYGPLRRSENA